MEGCFDESGETEASLTDEHAKYSGVLFAPMDYNGFPLSVRSRKLMSIICVGQCDIALAQFAPCLQTSVVVCFGPTLCTIAVRHY